MKAVYKRLVTAILTVMVICLSSPTAAEAAQNPRPAATDLEKLAGGTNGEFIQATSPEDAIRIYQQRSNSGRVSVSPQFAKGPCKLTAGYIHLRTSSSKRAVGFKPKTSCLVRVSVIRHDNMMDYKYGPLGLIWRTAYHSGATRSSLAVWEQLNIEHLCSSTTSGNTTWRGVTVGTVIYSGKSYYAVVTAPAKDLACKP